MLRKHWQNKVGCRPGRLEIRLVRPLQRRLLHSADLIVGIGYDTIEVEYEAWIGGVALLHVDIEPVDVAPTVKLVHQVTGDLDASLARLAASVSRHASKAMQADIGSAVAVLKTLSGCSMTEVLERMAKAELHGPGKSAE